MIKIIKKQIINEYIKNTTDQKINYKKLYNIEKERNKHLEKKLEQTNNELDELKLFFKSNEKKIEYIKVNSLSYTNSQTAKNGYMSI